MGGTSTTSIRAACGFASLLAIVLLAVLSGGSAFAADANKANGKKGKPRLSVADLAAPQSPLAAGKTVQVTGTLRNGGKRSYGGGDSPGTIDFELSGAGKASEPVGTGPIPRVKAKGKSPFSASIALPASFGPENGTAGPYTLTACVREKGDAGKRRCRASAGGLVLTPTIDPTNFVPGARTLGDRLFPQIGNGGYDARSYAIDLRYDPATNSFAPGTATTITVKATQDLSELSLDFQRALTVSGVTIDGVGAGFQQVDATPEFSPGNPDDTQPAKLVVTPPKGIREGSTFAVKVSYSGTPEKITDADDSFEGWVRACQVPQTQTLCDGSFTVNEPIGAQSWYPSNNYPSDKATIDTLITVPSTHVTIGTGELVAPPTVNGDGTATWRWSEDDPTSTYLASATVGLFDYSDSATVTETLTGRILPIYAAIDSAKLQSAKDTFNTRVGLIDGATNFFSDRFGPYPFDSTGAIVDIAPDVGYALENQTKPHYAGDATSAQGISTQAHEIAHQWMGDSVGPATWDEIWFNEGWATFAQQLYRSNQPGGATDAQLEAYFDTGYGNAGNDWSVPPAMPNGPENLFTTFPVYTRPSLMLEGYREIVGNAAFFAFARGLTTTYAYDVITIDQFIAAAKAGSGLAGPQLTLLDDYFRQWLLGTTKPTLTPDDF